MKINLTLDVSDDLRRLMGQAPECKKTRDGLAVREAVVRCVRAKVLAWSVMAEGFAVPAALTGDERDEYADAVSYLKALGWTDTQIKRWILKQRARHDYVNARL
jgi:hypothetical protein